MEAIGTLFSTVYELFSIPLEIFGFSFSFKSVMFFTCAAGIVLWAVRRIFYE